MLNVLIPAQVDMNLHKAPLEDPPNQRPTFYLSDQVRTTTRAPSMIN